MKHNTTIIELRSNAQQEEDKNLKSLVNKPTLAKILAGFGSFEILFGLFNLITGPVIMSNSFSNSVGKSITIDGLLGVFLGGLIFISSRLLLKEKKVSTWIYLSAILIDLVYKLVMDYSLNFIFIGFSLIILWLMLQSNNQLASPQS